MSFLSVLVTSLLLLVNSVYTTTLLEHLEQFINDGSLFLLRGSSNTSLARYQSAIPLSRVGPFQLNYMNGAPFHKNGMQYSDKENLNSKSNITITQTSSKNKRNDTNVKNIKTRLVNNNYLEDERSQGQLIINASVNCSTVYRGKKNLTLGVLDDLELRIEGCADVDFKPISLKQAALASALSPTKPIPQPVIVEQPSWTLPIVVVAIPTFNRPDFLIKSLDYVKYQQYARDRIRVAILDDSIESLHGNKVFEEKIAELNAVGIEVYYKHRVIVKEIGQENIGQKRNSLIRWVKDEIRIPETDFIFVHWDDDDWHAPHRIMKQALPLINGQSKLSALDLRTILLLHENKVYYRYAPDGKDVDTAMPIMAVNGGTLAYWASVWDENNRVSFPNLGCGEDIMFVDRIINAGHRVTLLDDSDMSVIYLRHEGNTWGGLDASSWKVLERSKLPWGLLDNLSFYRQMKNWKKLYWDGKMQHDEEIWTRTRGIDEVQTFIVNEIRGL